MAKIKVSTLISGIRGSIGGITFSGNKGGAYAKQWAAGPHTRYIPQQVRRTQFSGLSRDWGLLSSAQRSAWDTWAALPAQAKTDAFGDTYYVSGFGWFMTVNQFLLTIDRTQVTAPPTSTRPTAPTISSVSIASGITPAVQFNYTSGEFSGYDLVAFGAVGPFSVAVTWPAARGRFIGYKQAPVGGTFQVLIGIEDYLGELSTGQSFWTLVHRQTSDGQRSPGTLAMATVT